MINSTKILMLRDIELFSTLSTNEINTIANNSQLKRFHKNEFIYKSGSEINNVYIIENGCVKLGTETNNGKTLIKQLLYEHDILGENVFTGKMKRKEFAQVISDTTVIIIPVALFKDTVIKNVEFATSVMETIITRLNVVQNRMHNFVFKKAKQRILDFILNTGKLRGIRIGIDECLINHGMSHKEIAYLTDTSRQTVARVLGELKRENLIHFSPRKPSKILIRGFAH